MEQAHSLSVELPFVDEHEANIATDVEQVWSALVETLDGVFSRKGAAAYARVVGCADSSVSGPRPLTVGSTVPGFRVEAAVRGVELVLAGRHRFSTYLLTFRLEPVGAGRSRLTAETRAAFPGVMGGAYRLLVIGSRGHVVVLRRLLTGIGHRAEAMRT